MKRIFFGILITGIALLSLSASQVSALSLGTAELYNAFIFEDFSATNSDLQGRLAAGGDVSLGSYAVGSGLSADGSGSATDTLVAGGDLTFTNGQIFKGNASVGGTADVSGFNMADGILAQNATIPVDFTTEKNYLTGLSGQLASMTATGTVESKWGGLYLQGDGTSDVQVFNFDGGLLNSINNFAFSSDNPGVPENATLIFNISGDTASMQYCGMDLFSNILGSSYENVLFNFYEATALDFSGIGIQGSILAPFANVTANSGDIYGTIIAKSWSGGMALHNAPFHSDAGSQSPVPEPGTFILISLGLLGIAGYLRRKK